MPKYIPEGTFPLAGRSVNRVGYGAMQLAGPGVFGPPQGSRRIGRRASRSGGVRRQSHRYQRLLWTAHHQPDHPRSAPPIPR